MTVTSETEVYRIEPAMGHQNQCLQHQPRGQRQIDRQLLGRGGSRDPRGGVVGMSSFGEDRIYQVTKTPEVPGGLQTPIILTFPETGLFPIPIPVINSGSVF